MTWQEKYRPKKVSEIIGQEEAKHKISDFIKNFKQQDKKSLLLYGAPGSGKTSIVHAIANTLNLEIIELNASDFRNKEQIQEIIGNAICQQSLFCKSKIILIDELEGVSGHEDRGGIQELLRLIETTTYPIIMTCVDPYHEKLRKIKSNSINVELKQLSIGDLIKILYNLSESENIKIEPELIKELALKTKGDARAAINDLQVLSILGRKITRNDLDLLDSREKDETIFNALKKVLQTRDSRGAFDQVQNHDYEDIFLWLDENLPLEYKGIELEKAYEMLSLADLYKGRIIRRQHWRFLAYIFDFITQGIAISKTQEKISLIKYKMPSRILKIWMIKQKQAQRKSIAEKLAKKIHTSKNQAEEDLEYLKIALKTPNQICSFAKELKLEEKEIDWLKI
jgi:replication factor C large subunit